MLNEERQQILGPPSATRAAWCCFDHEWYLQAYSEVHNVIDDESFPAARQYYLEHGHTLGHSPNMLFDEGWYLRRYPDVAAQVAEGDIGSGYEHYCTLGWLNRSPHWLYDDETYASYSPDVTDRVLIGLECFNRYDHYLKYGSREGRIAHLLFDPITYRTDAAALSHSAGEIDAMGAFAHYLQRIWRDRVDSKTSVYFDPAWYLEHNAGARAAVEAGEFASALHHYLAAPGSHDPRPQFSEGFYLDQNPDVAAAIEAGSFTSGYEHFLKSGVFKLRAPAVDVDLEGYAVHHPEAEQSVETGSYRDVFEYMLRNQTEIEAAKEPEPAITGRGHIDFYGYHTAAHGWFFCGWVSPEHPAVDGRVNVIAYFEQGKISGAAALSTLPRPDLGGDGVGVVIYLRGSGRPMGGLISLSLAGEGATWTAFPPETALILRDEHLLTQLRPILGSLRPNASRDALAGLAARRGYTGSNTLGELSDRVFVEIDQSIFCPPDGVLLIGWMLSHPGTVRAIRLHSGHDTMALQPEKFLRIPRPDVLDTIGAQHGFQELQCGFMAFLGNAYTRDDHAYLEVETTRGEVGYRNVPEPKLGGMQAIRFLLDRFDVRYGDLVRVLDNVVGPAVASLNRERLRERPGFEVIAFGAQPAAPVVSVIVALYGRIDFMEHQFALFSRHAPALEHEFIYVLDEPAKARQAEVLAASIYARFRIPLKLVVLARNVGFGPANNTGLAQARGQYVCFMNSDIFPDRDDWMERMVESLRAHPDVGAVAPMLLFEDRSVQHMGMAFEPLPEFGDWLFPMHERKGWRPPAQRGLRRCRAITGAFMLMERRIAGELGGFDESFVIGDFEDSDLCLRLAQRGLASAVDLDVTMYHLERQSQAGSEQRWRQNLTLYNAWLHEGRWGEHLRRPAAPVEAAAPMAGSAIQTPSDSGRRRRARPARVAAEAKEPA